MDGACSCRASGVATVRLARDAGADPASATDDWLLSAMPHTVNTPMTDVNNNDLLNMMKHSLMSGQL